MIYPPADTGSLKQRLKPQVCGLRKVTQSQLDDHPVFPGQGNHVGDRPDSDHFQEMGHQIAPPTLGKHGLHDLEPHSDGCQFFVRVVAVGPLRIEHSQGLRQCFGG